MLTLTPRIIKLRSWTIEDAIAISKQHWQEMATASDAELKKAPEDLIGTDYCGLCQYYKQTTEARHCIGCPYDCAVPSTWHKAFVAYRNSFWDLFREFAAEIVIELEYL